MVNRENIQTPSTSKRWFIVGGILLLIGLAGILRFIFEGMNTPVEGNAPADGAWQAATIIGGAVFTGAGLVLIVIGFIKRSKLSQKRDELPR